MQDIIDLCNHVMVYSDVYHGRHQPPADLMEDMKGLVHQHGEEFCISFLTNYFKLEEHNE